MFDNILLTAFYIALLALIVLLIVAIALMLFKIAHTALDLSSISIHKNKQNILIEAHEKAEKIINEAREKSLNIIEETEKSSRSYLDSHEAYLNRLHERHETLLLKTSKHHIASLEEELAALKQQLMSLAQQSSDMFKGNIVLIEKDFATKSQEVLSKVDASILSQSETIKTEILHNLENAQSKLEAKTASAYEEALKEVEAYKIARMTKLDANMYSIINEVTMKVFGNSLSIEEHQSYIMKTLEESKHLLST